MQNHNYSAKKTFPVASAMGSGKLYTTQNNNLRDTIDIFGMFLVYFNVYYLIEKYCYFPKRKGGYIVFATYTVFNYCTAA